MAVIEGALARVAAARRGDHRRIDDAATGFIRSST
jgi:hypothetical protein